MLKVYSDFEHFDGVSETFEYMMSSGIDIDERTLTVHVIALNRVGDVQKGLDFLNGEIRKSRELVEEMASRGIKPDIITFNIMVDACGKRWNFSELDLMLPLMEKEGVAFDVKTYQFLIDGFTSLVGEMHEKGLKVETHVYNLIINSYCRMRSLESALSLFSKMAERRTFQNADTYWFLINGLCKVGDMELAMQYVNEMQNKGFKIDHLVFNILADGFRNKGMTNEVFELQALMERKGGVNTK
ncbi:hypothetical protein M0R45_016745 [Rubus argutus]|uniref:Pentatricopeptide repeat-containing protein n=1 Tax=Rubus argutus TaxID=59490 RepID=A0AAW1XTI9_RUBAR